MVPTRQSHSPKKEGGDKRKRSEIYMLLEVNHHIASGKKEDEKGSYHK